MLRIYYEPGDEWEDATCDLCGARVTPDNAVSCEYCAERVCDNEPPCGCKRWLDEDLDYEWSRA